MNNRLAGDVLVYFAAFTLSKALSLLSVIFFARYMSPSDFGGVDIVTAAASLANVLLPLEVTQALARYYPAEHSSTARKEYASTTLWFTVGVFGVFLVVAGIKVSDVSDLLFDRNYPQAAWAAIFVICLGGIYYVLQQQLRLDFRSRAFATLTMLQTVVSLLVATVGVIGLRLGMLGYFYATVASLVFGILAGGYMGRDALRLGFKVARLRELLEFSWPLVPGSLCVMGMLYLDRAMIKEMLTLTELGLFGIAGRFASIASFLISGFQIGLLPHIYRNMQDPGLPQQLARVTRLFVAASLVALVGLGVFAREVIVLLVSGRYLASAPLVPLMFASVLMFNMYVFFPGMGIAKKTGWSAAISFVGASVNILLNLLWIPTHGLIGAAGAAVCSSFVFLVLRVVASQRYFPVPFGFGRIALMAGLSAFCVVLGQATDAFGWPVALLWLTKLALVVLFSISMFLGRLVTFAELLSLWGTLRSRGGMPVGSS